MAAKKEQETPESTEDSAYVVQAQARADAAKEDAERAAEVKSARESRKGKKLAQSVVIFDDRTGEYVTVGPTDFDPTDFKSWDPSKPHSVNGVPTDDSDISYLLDQIQNPNAWA